jgi:competence protein ComEC
VKLPAFWSAILLMVGIWIGHEIAISDFIVFMVALLFFCAGLIVYLMKIRRFSWLIVSSAILICGIFRISLDCGNLPNNDISHFNDLEDKVIIAGEIIREPDLRPSKTYLTLKADTVFYNSASIPVSGKVMIRLNYFSSLYNYADYIRVTGYLSTPMCARNPGSFDYSQFLLVKNIRSFLSVKRSSGIEKVGLQRGNIFLTEVVIPLRKVILSIFDRYLSSPQKSLIAGFVIGETRFIPSEVFQHFRDTGTLHLLAVSGSNVALVIGTVMFFLLLFRVPIKYRHIISIAVIILFSNLSYNQPSVIRASVMIGLYLFGRLAYRRTNYINVISVAAFIILIFNPMMLWDVGFQLSFCAAFGLIYFLPIIYNRLSPKGGWVKKLPSFMLMTFLSSVVAQLAVAPILAYHFNTIPLIGFLSNLIIVPLSSLAVIMALILSFFSWLPPVAEYIGIVTDALLKLTISAVDFFATMPVVKLNISSPDWIVIILYYMVIIFSFGMVRKFAMIKYLLIAVLVFVNIIVWRGYLDELDDKTYLTVFDVGQHSLIYMNLPGRSSSLLGKVSAKSKFNQIEHALVPFCKKSGLRKIDRVIPLDSVFKDSIDSILSNSGIKCNLNSNPFCFKKDSLVDYDKESIKLLRLESSERIIAVVYQRDRTKVIIINDLSQFTGLYESNPQLFTTVDALLIPEPLKIINTLYNKILDINPNSVIFYSYSYRYSIPVGYDKLTESLQSQEINLFNTRDHGAITIKISSSGLEVLSTISCD